MSEKLGLAINCVSDTVINIIFAFVYGWELSLVILSLAPVIIVTNTLIVKV